MARAKSLKAKIPSAGRSRSSTLSGNKIKLAEPKARLVRSRGWSQTQTPTFSNYSKAPQSFLPIWDYSEKPPLLITRHREFHFNDATLYTLDDHLRCAFTLLYARACAYLAYYHAGVESGNLNIQAQVFAIFLNRIVIRGLGPLYTCGRAERSRKQGGRHLHCKWGNLTGKGFNDFRTVVANYKAGLPCYTGFQNMVGPWSEDKLMDEIKKSNPSLLDQVPDVATLPTMEIQTKEKRQRQKRSRTTSSVEDVTKSGRDWVGEGAQPPFQELAVMMEPHRFKKPRTVKVNKTTEKSLPIVAMPLECFLYRGIFLADRAGDVPKLFAGAKSLLTYTGRLPGVEQTKFVSSILQGLEGVLISQRVDLIVPGGGFESIEEVDLFIGKVAGAAHDILARLGSELA